MIYDNNSGALYRADGKFLKTVYCPMTIRLNDLAKVAVDSPDRKCHSCGEIVKSIDDLSEMEVEKLVTANPNVCVFATAQVKNVVFLKPIGHIATNYDEDLVIKTARNLQTMNDAQQRGFHLVIKDTGVSNDFGKFKYQLLQNKVSGELSWTNDYRQLSVGDGDWEVKRSFTHVRQDRPFPIAAYLIPPGLPAGTNVYVEDLIDDVKMVMHNQGDAVRVVSAVGIWNGVDIKFDEEDFNRPMFCG
jgi:hypothetical protein